ncbi:BREX system P-loop protein BrxC [Mycolicibacterium monacense]|uniref:BREX system P-loop protein BrxC n=1 Tax=Mycolicibacterium monacense TaxID=85693 RepID=UPI000A6B20A8|nr:BREX system P-loop protein BrxC [Mycolicibacterium monacense]
MKVAEVFRRPITRRIEPVIKVESDDEETVAAELDEYVATPRIISSFEQIVEAYQERIDNPNEDVNVWVSGFFGSGKSSFAKVLGYLLANPTIQGKSAADRFFSRVTAPRLKQMLETSVYSRASTISVFVDLLSARNVKIEGESVVLPLYRALLERLDYSTSLQLAELEFALEGDNRLSEFEERFEATFAKTWRSRREIVLAKNEASRIMHEMDPSTYPSPDSFAKTPFDQALSAQDFAARAIDLLERRGGGAQRIFFVVDEAGQYISRWVNRVGDLQGVAESFQARRGPLWLLATSQERLDDIIDSLEGNRTELGRIKDRFIKPPIDLLPTDIEDVVTSRVLQKSNVGQTAVRDAYQQNPNKFSNNVKLASATREADPTEMQVVNLYPLLPYQVRLLVDAVSTRRAAGGNAGQMGGSARTIIGFAQKVVTDPAYGIGSEDVGALATIDRAFNYFESLVPPSWRDEVEQVAGQHGGDSVVVRVLKAIAFLVDVRDLPLTVRNIAATLHPSMQAEALDSDVTVALETLVTEGRIRFDGTGYRVQSPEEKTWAEARNAIAARPADVNRLRKSILRDRLAGLAVTKGRTFRLELTVGDEKLSAGEVALIIEEADEDRLREIVAQTREPKERNRIWWTYTISNDTNQALEELHKSAQMIARRDTASRTGLDAELIAQEKRQQFEWEDKARRGLEADLMKGRVVFRGVDAAVPSGSDIRAVTQKFIHDDYLADIYSKLDEFSAVLKASDPLLLIRDSSLDGVPDSLGPSGIRLVKQTPSGREIDTNAGPLPTMLAEIKNRDGYGTEVTGALLLQLFGAPPYGASTEVIQAIAAGAVRQGLVDVKTQGALIKNASDHRLDPVFKGPQAFRNAVFKPHEDTIGLEKRVGLGRKLASITGVKPNTDVASLAASARDVFGPVGIAASKVVNTLRGLGLPVPATVVQIAATVKDISADDDEMAVTTAIGSWEDLAEGRTVVENLSTIVDNNLGDLRLAKQIAAFDASGLDEQAIANHAELCDLIDAGDIASELARIIALAQAVDNARKERLQTVRERLVEAVAAERNVLSGNYTQLESDVVAEALTDLDRLIPADDQEVSAEVMEARCDSISTTVARVRQRLDEVVARDRLATISVAEVVADLIASPEDLTAALQRIQASVEELLADGKQVRLM